MIRDHSFINLTSPYIPGKLGIQLGTNAGSPYTDLHYDAGLRRGEVAPYNNTAQKIADMIVASANRYVYWADGQTVEPTFLGTGIPSTTSTWSAVGVNGLGWAQNINARVQSTFAINGWETAAYYDRLTAFNPSDFYAGGGSDLTAGPYYTGIVGVSNASVHPHANGYARLASIYFDAIAGNQDTYFIDDTKAITDGEYDILTGTSLFPATLASLNAAPDLPGGTSGRTIKISGNANLSITPINLSTPNQSEKVNITIPVWENTGNHHKQWVESSSVLGTTQTLHTIGDLEPSKYYNLQIDNSPATTNITGDTCSNINDTEVCQSDTDGKIIFTYTGGYSTHTFDLTEGDNSGPVTTATPAGGEYYTTQTVTLTCNDESGIGCDKTYYTTDGTDPNTNSTQYSAPIAISTTTTLKFFSTDLDTNTEAIRTQTYTIIPEEDDNSDDNQRNLNVHKVSSSATANSIAINWKTDHATKDAVFYGADKNLKHKKQDQQKTKKHTLTIKNLNPDTTYYFKIKSEDNSNNEDTSKIHQIKTQTVSTEVSASEKSASGQSAPGAAPGSGLSASTCNYTIQSGDTLWSIAKKVYNDGSQYQKIMELNQGANTNTLKIGQELKTCDGNQASQGEVKNDTGVTTQNNPQDAINRVSTTSSETKTFQWWNPWTWF